MGARRHTAMELGRFKQLYLLGAAIVWVGLFLALALSLAGTPYYGQILPLLSGGAVWFVVIIPGVLRTVR
jgi:hypothetical protein